MNFMVPQIKSNAFKAIYVGLLYALFKLCVDGVALRIFGINNITAMLVASTVVALVSFTYLAYLIFDSQDRKDERQSSQRKHISHS